LPGCFPYCGTLHRLTFRPQPDKASAFRLQVHVMDFVVVPRRRSYWIEEIQDGGERRVIECCPSEDEALKRLNYLRERQWAREDRRMAEEKSRFNTSNILAST
jgi:hypothetical protein